jgi:hypothetical protein
MAGAFGSVSIISWKDYPSDRNENETVLPY